MLPYGIVGNCNTCALISKNGGVDWLCFPDFASPSVFARLLDEKQGGTLRVRPVGTYKVTQQYLPDTAILETTFTSNRAAFQIHDFFPRYRKLLKNKHQRLYKQNRLIRIIRVLKGKPKLRIQYDPKPNYARETCDLQEKESQLMACGTQQEISLISNIPYATINKQETYELRHTVYLVVGTPDDAQNFNVRHCKNLLNATKQYWRRWVKSLVCPEAGKEVIVRSAITLKLLTYSTTGAILASATTSIPEELGAERNWDYRFCWVRDAALTVDALKRIGRNYEPKRLLDFIIKGIPKAHLQIMYGINGERDLKEEILDHLAGFKGCKPVRIGNAAYGQKQNDIYGEIIDIMYLYYVYYQYEPKMTEKYWSFLKHLVREIKYHWKEKDSGIWEFRGMQEHYTHSLLMCYVGIDRAMRIAQHYGKETLATRWTELRDEILHRLLTKHYNEEVNAFTMFSGSKELDASVLLLASHEVLPPDDQRLINTVKAVYKRLRVGALVQRYKMEDDFGKSGSAFTICSFWLLEALCYIGETEKARKLYNRLLRYANHLGLYSEDIDIRTGRLLGNFPQAYTHIALINTTLLLSEWNAKRKKLEQPTKRQKIW